MPTYEYRCPKGHEFETFQRMSEEPVAACPECGTAAVRLLSAGAGFLFKGDGFYITDYRSDSYRAAAKKEGAASGADAGKDASSGSGGSDAPAKEKKASSAGASSGGASGSKSSAGSGTSGGSSAASD